MQIEVCDTAHGKEVLVDGEITADTSALLRERLLQLALEAPPVVTVNLKNVRFIDSSGIGVFVGVRGHLKKNEITLHLTHVHPQVARVFEIMRLAKVFGIHSGH